MTLVLDTATLPSSEREDAVHAVIERMSVPTTVSLSGDAALTSRMDVWQFGAVSTLRHQGRPVQLLRTPRHVRQDAPEVVSLIIQLRGRSRHVQHGRIHEAPAGHMIMADLTSNYESEVGDASLAAYILYEDLEVGVDTGRRAMHRLHTSPLYDLVRRHLIQVSGCAEDTRDPAATAAVGAATVSLVRGLLASAAENGTRQDTLRETLVARIEDFVRRHLPNPALSPDLVARAHHISVRALHDLWCTHDVTFMEWVMRERLDGACRELQGEHPGRRDVTVAATARRWGFKDATHFSRRFRASYGLPPAQWREAHLSRDRVHPALPRTDPAR